jgi:DNA mismatch repair protein MLH1
MCVFNILFTQKALDSVYSTYLAKGKHPFVYLSMEIAPQNVDVNVHPTKHEVHFLHEDAIIHKIQTAADILLKGASTSRSFTVQVIYPIVSDEDSTLKLNFLQTLIPKNPAPLVDKSSTASASNVSKVYDKDLVRTDGRTQKIDKFLSSSTVESSTFESLDRSDLLSTTSSDILQKAVQRVEDQPKQKFVQQPAQQLSTNRGKSYSPAVETSFLRSTDRSAKGPTASTSTAGSF